MKNLERPATFRDLLIFFSLTYMMIPPHSIIDIAFFGIALFAIFAKKNPTNDTGTEV